MEQQRISDWYLLLLSSYNIQTKHFPHPNNGEITTMINKQDAHCIMSELGFDWRGRSCPGVGVAIVNGAPSRSQLAASPLASGGLPICPRLGALLEMPQLLLVVFIQHLHVAVGLTEFLKENHMQTVFKSPFRPNNYNNYNNYAPA